MPSNPDLGSEPELLVEAKDLVKEYHPGATVVPALRGVSINIRRGAFVVIQGPSGSGKSTLLNLLGCLDHPSRGNIRIAGEDVEKLGDAQLSAFRARRLGFIFQSFNLIAVLSAFENVEYPLRLNHVPRREARPRALAMLETLGLLEYAERRPAELSGGQQQRVAIARALVNNPDLVLADEPTANLDSATGERIVNRMREMQQKFGTAFVIATHDPMVTAHAEERHKLHDGRLQD
jgi:putative ABC transport system ATP-binding protein